MSVILDFFDNVVDRFPNKTAVITNERECTYQQLAELSNFTATLLSEYQQRKVVSIVMDNTIESIGAYLGTLRAGCIAHLLSQNMSKESLTEQLISAEPVLVLCAQDIIDRIETKSKKMHFDSRTIAHYENERKIVPDDVAYLIYTSGTTSEPKGVGVSHANAVFTTKNIVSVLEYSEEDRDVLPLPLSHSFGLGCMHASFYVGSTLILHKNTINSFELLESIKRHGATTFAAVPATLTKLLDEYGSKMERYFSDLRLVITNSTAIPENTVKSFRKILKKGRLATYYGLTEASRSTFMKFNSDGKESSVGIPAPGVQIKLVDQEGNEVDDGEIWIKGLNVIKGYWKDSSVMNPVEGWLKTGDLGRFDDEGYLYLKGRTDDIINVAGEKVNPQHVERIVKLLADIEEAVAVGVKHETFGQVVKLFVKKTAGSHITKSDIIIHCIKNLERYKIPVNIEFVDDFPRTEYGKIKRFMLTSHR